MQEALLAFGRLGRAGIFGKPVDDRGCDLDRVLHPALGKARMRADALDDDGGTVGGKGFVLDMAGAFTVHRVGEFRAELPQVDLVDAAADFLIGG